ncbi:MAG: Mur ligase family protein [Chloroflexi bacterium]|nr:Mur ligase family protein [Chloroflexota bacterium]
MRLAAAVAAGKGVAFLSRHLNLGGGTTFPGEVTRRIDARALEKMAARLREGSVVVTGTNGKTTTSRMIANILRESGLRPVHNRSGANLITGVTSALLNSASLFGIPQGEIGLFEVDEATLPSAVKEIQPKAVVVNNLFRDQLDRYGEIDYIAGIWREALRALPAAASVVLNADDPLVASLGTVRPVATENTESTERTNLLPLGQGTAPSLALPLQREGTGRTSAVYYGIEDERYGMAGLQHAADSKNCVSCGARYQYRVAFYGHVGKYSCPACGYRRPSPLVAATKLLLRGTEGSEVEIATPAGMLELRLKLPGLYNVYNALAAVACALTLGIPREDVVRGMETFSAAFGRIERVQVGDKQVYLALVKNPVGFNEVLRTLFLEERPRELLILINDNIADGTDISWLWDVDFELLRGKVASVVVSGTRAEDMQLRLKYALVDMSRVALEKDLYQALQTGLWQIEKGGTLYVLPTYTAMLEIRAVMQRLGYVGRFWED